LPRRKRPAPVGTGLGRDPVCGGSVFGRQHHLTGLQAHAVAAFNALQDFFGFFAALGHDLGELFKQGFGHATRAEARTLCIAFQLNDSINK